MQTVVGFPMGTGCRTALLFGLREETVESRIFCNKTTGYDIQVWGYQFFGKAEYVAGLRHINSYTGFISDTDQCPPLGDYADGLTTWSSAPHYPPHPGQVIECFTDGGRPLLIWSMPTQNVFFIGEDSADDATMSDITSWWASLRYG